MTRRRRRPSDKGRIRGNADWKGSKYHLLFITSRSKPRVRCKVSNVVLDNCSRKVLIFQLFSIIPNFYYETSRRFASNFKCRLDNCCREGFEISLILNYATTSVSKLVTCMRQVSNVVWKLVAEMFYIIILNYCSLPTVFALSYRWHGNRKEQLR